jgi:hypothetical protein
MSMRIPRQSIIAGIVICFILIVLFIVFQVFIDQLNLIVENKSTIFLTPIGENEKSNNSSKNNLGSNLSPTETVFFSNGTHVHINNTGGEGLIIRDFAGFDGKPLYLGFDEEEFEIIEGPTMIDDHIWWKIKSIVDPQKEGWSIQDFLFFE